MLKMRLQYLNDYDNQSRDLEQRLRLIFLSRTKKRDAQGGFEGTSCVCVSFLQLLPENAFLVAN